MKLGSDFDEFVVRASPGLLRTAYFLCGDRGHAEDLLQTTLLRTARRWRAASANPTAYARTVLANLVKDRWRESSRRVVEAPLADIDDRGRHDPDLAVLLERDILVRALRQLPSGQRTVLVLRYFDDLPVEEVARLLGCGSGSVKSQTYHALARLKTLLAAGAGTRTEEDSRC